MQLGRVLPEGLQEERASRTPLWMMLFHVEDRSGRRRTTMGYHGDQVARNRALVPGESSDK